MRTAKTVDDSIKKRLNKAVRTYGMQQPIIDATGIPSKTLKRLAKAGSANAIVVDKVTLYFTQATPPPLHGLDIVCEAYGIKEEDITSRKNYEARQVAAYILSVQRSPKLTFTEIARQLKYKDHSGVHAAVNAISDRMDVELALKKKVFSLQSKVSA